jgi:NAD(P)-dependent dehydrogenase (short-subunit alcohol dehydrogenase family)
VSQRAPVVLITGASRGLGRALVESFLRRGCAVLGLIRSQRDAEELSSAHPKGFQTVIADVTSPEAVAACETAIATHHRVLDILVNNAGSRGYLTSITQAPEQEVSKLFALHCLGALRITRAALPFLQKSSRGLVVNITSRMGSIARTVARDFPSKDLSYSYRVSKAAQNMLTLCLSQELRSEGISVCAVHPGRLRTDSGPPDPEMSAGEGAERLTDWILAANDSVNGGYFELDTGRTHW